MASAAHLVCFRIGKENFGVDIFSVREIVKAREITPVPGTAEHVLGIINLRGKIISVVDLAQRLGLGAATVDRQSRIFVVDLDGVTVGFLVDAATEVMKLSGESIEPAPKSSKALFATTICKALASSKTTSSSFWICATFSWKVKWSRSTRSPPRAAEPRGRVPPHDRSDQRE